MRVERTLWALFQGGAPSYAAQLWDGKDPHAVAAGQKDLEGLPPRPPGCRRSSELFRQEFSVESFLNPPTLFHPTLVDVTVLGRKGEFRFASACK